MQVSYTQRCAVCCRGDLGELSGPGSGHGGAALAHSQDAGQVDQRDGQRGSETERIPGAEQTGSCSRDTLYFIRNTNEQ